VRRFVVGARAELAPRVARQLPLEQVLRARRRAGTFDLSHFKQHIGIYGYRAGVLNQLSTLAPSLLEQTEMLEQLRWLENGYSIYTTRSEHLSWSIDTAEDLKKVQQHFGF
jgi:CMP-2-keto-3-deoxyoctulosonic acid synthetase